MASRRVRAAAQGRIAAAAATWERAGTPRAMRDLAAALLAGGRTEAAVDLLQRHRDRLDADADLMRLWAVALRRAGRWAEAAAAFERLAAVLKAGAVGGAGGSAAGGACGSAAVGGWRAQADWAGAEAMACRVHDRDPADAAEALRLLLLLPSVAANPYALALHGRLLMRAGQPGAAVAPLLQATAALPEDAGVAVAAAFAVRRARGEAAAIPLLVRALRIRPDQRAVLATLVADAVRLRRVAATRRSLIELARSAPSAGPVWNAVRRLGAAGAAAAAGEGPAAGVGQGPRQGPRQGRGGGRGSCQGPRQGSRQGPCQGSRQGPCQGRGGGRGSRPTGC